MKYGKIIQELTARGQNYYCYYDQNFCFLRQRRHLPLLGGGLHGKLWLCGKSLFTRKPQPEHAAKTWVQANLPRLLWVSVLNITGAWLVQSVRLSIPVRGVQVTIGQLCVIFDPQISPPIVTPSQPSPDLPTPIKVDRLISLLSGYNHSTTEFLHCHCSLVFQFIPKVKECLEHPKFLFLLFYIPQL